MDLVRDDGDHASRPAGHARHADGRAAGRGQRLRRPAAANAPPARESLGAGVVVPLTDRHVGAGGPDPQPPYTRLGSHNPICGNMYSRKMGITWSTMNGIIPRKIWFSVTCAGATPF